MVEKGSKFKEDLRGYNICQIIKDSSIRTKKAEFPEEILKKF